MSEYQITTIDDLMAIPLERIDACLADLKRAVLAVYAVREIAGVPIKPLGAITWRDDGRDAARISVVSSTTGEPIVACFIGRDDPLEHLSDGMEAPGA